MQQQGKTKTKLPLYIKKHFIQDKELGRGNTFGREGVIESAADTLKTFLGSKGSLPWEQGNTTFKNK
jgi:hypothetical protein